MWSPNSHQYGLKAASNTKVVPKSKMVNLCLQKGHQATILESWSGPKVVTKQPINSFSTSARGSQKYFWCLDLFTCKFIPKHFFKFISQTIFTKLWMLFFVVCKKMIAVCYEQGLYIQWAFSLTLCIKETEDILGVEYGS